jgi:cytochrome P450
MIPSDYAVRQTTVQDFLNDTVFQLYRKAKGAPAGQFSVPIFSDPASTHKILGEPTRFPKNMGLIRALGDSRFTTNGKDWELRRDISQGAYLSAGSADNSSKVSAVYSARFAECDATPEGVQRALLLASSEIFFRAFRCETEVEGLLGFFDRTRQYLKRLQYYCWNSPSSSDISTLREHATAVIADFAALASGSASIKRLLTMFRNRADGLRDFDPLEELLMNFFAGIETTAATLSFAIDRLGIDSRVQKRLHDEVEAASSETYLNCFLLETMRYFPAIPFVVRDVAADLVLNDISLQKGQTILLSIVGLHHNSMHWNEPEIFDCSRPEFLEDTYNRRAFLPFLAGQRMCGGAKLAKLELMEGLKAFVRHFIVSGPTEEIGFDYGLALRPKSWTEIKFSRRHH